MLNPNPSRHEVSFIPGVIWSRRRNWCRAPRVRRRRSYRLLRARAQERGADKAERGRGRGTRPDRTGHDQTRQRQGSAAPASRAAVQTDGGHVRFSLVEFGLIFRLVKFLGLFIGVLRELFYFIVMVSVCVVGLFWLVYVGFVSGKSCLVVVVGHLVVFLIVL